MTWLLKILAGRLGAFVLGGVAVLFAGLVLTIALQGLQLDRMTSQRDAARTLARDNYIAAESWRALIPGWRAYAGKIQAARQLEAGEATTAVTTGTAQTAQASSGAFDQGYAAGRAAGHKTCGVTPNASFANPGAVLRGPAAGGVRVDPGDDFADLFGRRAYKPAH